MPFIIPDNSVSRDLPHIRQARLDLIVANIDALAPILSLPPELLNWAHIAAGKYRAAFNNIEIQWGQKEEAIQTVQQAEDALRERYAVLKELLHARYGDDNTKNSYAIEGDIPEARGILESKAEKLIETHGIQKMAGDPMVLPDVMINNLQTLRDTMHAAQIVSDTEFKEAKDSTKEALTIFEADTYMLRVFYNWCVAVWGKDSTNMLLVGFVQRYPGGGGGGGDVPVAPLGFELKWVEPMLKFEWEAVEGATSYQLAFSADDGATWEELYSGDEREFGYEPPEGQRHYRVRARNANGYGDWSETLTHEVEGEAPVGSWPNEVQGLYAIHHDVPVVFNEVGCALQAGAESYRLKRVKVLIADPDPTDADMPDDNYIEELTGDPYGDADIAVGDKCAYWMCGVQDGVEGAWAGPVICVYEE